MCVGGEKKFILGKTKEEKIRGSLNSMCSGKLGNISTLFVLMEYGYMFLGN
jgi:hypothetical protein